MQAPVERDGGKVIDGRRRLRACEMAGVTPRFKDVSPADPVAYVLSLNLHRRHLNPSQLAMVAARARELYDRAAKERQKEAGKVHGRGKEKVPANLPEPISQGDARDAVGKAVGVSGRSVDYATRVLKHGEPELVKAVDEGRLAVSTAAVHATDPPQRLRSRPRPERPGRRRPGPHRSRLAPEAARWREDGRVRVTGPRWWWWWWWCATSARPGSPGRSRSTSGRAPASRWCSLAGGRRTRTP